MQEENNIPQKSKRSPVIGSIIVILIIMLAGWYVYTKEFRSSPSEGDSSNSATSTINIGGVTMQVPAGGGTIEQVPIEEVNIGPAPSLDRKISFPASFPEEARLVWQQKVDVFKSALAKDPHSYGDWINLGLMWQTVNDFEGAKQAWTYATKIAPTVSTAFGNLGFLYGYQLHDTVKGESNFKKALSIDPTALYLYQQTFEFYRDVLKDPDKARALAEQGRQSTGNDAYFDRLLATL